MGLFLHGKVVITGEEPLRLRILNDGMAKFEGYLWKNGVKKITGFFIERKNYLWFYFG